MEIEPRRSRKLVQIVRSRRGGHRAAFAIVAVRHAPGIAYVIVAGLCYSLIRVFSRRY